MNVNGREFNNVFSAAPFVPLFFLEDETRSQLEYFGGSMTYSSADDKFQPNFQMENSILAAVLPQEVTWKLAQNRRTLFESAGFQHLKTRTARRILRRN